MGSDLPDPVLAPPTPVGPTEVQCGDERHSSSIIKGCASYRSLPLSLARIYTSSVRGVVCHPDSGSEFIKSTEHSACAAIEGRRLPWSKEPVTGQPGRLPRVERLAQHRT